MANHPCYAEGKHDGMLVSAEHLKAERARFRREEVEPLREALLGLIAWWDSTKRRPYHSGLVAAILAARSALRAADKGEGK